MQAMLILSGTAKSQLDAKTSEYDYCPYCGEPLTNADDVTGDGEALYCAECGQRVEIADAMEKMIAV